MTNPASFHPITPRGTVPATTGTALRRLILAAVFLGLPVPALAGPAADTVRAFYLPEPIGEADPANRDRFTGAAAAALARNDRQSDNGEEVGCIDWGLAIDAQDFDAPIIARTLKLEENVKGAGATVTARFQLFPEGEEIDRTIVWTLEDVGGAWKVSDVEAPGNWRLSELCR